ncbi:MAG: prepilin-type N-terminal cleavage/methylation domain-containing protein [Candidatus Paceibacterota bacterium]|jgi:prepilin-type N-terminal cleavage/methylation domain-containing protein|nr:prepilin-type N-terminal cleavage/methylation domain-containing protein [bacterium]
MNKRKNKNRKGFSLIEMLVSVFIISFALISMFGLNSKYNQQTKQEKEAYEASLLAEEGVEIVKNMRDSNWICATLPCGTSWDNGLTTCGSGCEIDYLKKGGDGTTTGLTSWTNPGNFLYIDPTTKLYRYPSSGEVSTLQLTPYRRKITIDSTTADRLRIIVTVSWYNYTTEVKQDIYNWRQ